MKPLHFFYFWCLSWFYLLTKNAFYFSYLGVGLQDFCVSSPQKGLLFWIRHVLNSVQPSPLVSDGQKHESAEGEWKCEERNVVLKCKKNIWIFCYNGRHWVNSIISCQFSHYWKKGFVVVAWKKKGKYISQFPVDWATQWPTFESFGVTFTMYIIRAHHYVWEPAKPNASLTSGLTLSYNSP